MNLLESGKLRKLQYLCVVLVVVGAVAFLIGVNGPAAQRTWQAFLINFVFWSGISFGAVVFVAVLNLIGARWARPIKRLAEALGAFLPVCFLLFWVLFFGREEIFHWIHEPVAGKEGWLNSGFLFARDGLGILLLTAVAMAIVYASIRSDAGSADHGVLTAKSWRTQKILSPVLAILYALVLSLIAFDLIMSLDPHWYSTLFGAYYFVGSFYTALAALVILSFIGQRALGLDRYITPKLFHDMGKLIFGFCLLTGDFFYSQFLVIWYGNLPEETHYVLLRVRQAPWESLAWVVLGICFALPFIVLLSRKVKMNSGYLAVVSAVILVGMWLERLLLVAPSLWKGDSIPIGLVEVFVTLGFFGAMAGSITIFLQRVPLLPHSDPLFEKFLQSQGEKLEAA